MQGFDTARLQLDANSFMQSDSKGAHYREVKFSKQVGYPGFAYLRNRRPLNPAEVLLRALRAGDVDARMVEGTTLGAVEVPGSRLGVAPARSKRGRPSEPAGISGVGRPTTGRASRRNRSGEELAEQEQTLEGSRLQREGAFRESLTDAERRWLREKQPPHATHWNMFSTVNASELANAF
jgi:hypothetical protein